MAKHDMQQQGEQTARTPGRKGSGKGAAGAMSRRHYRSLQEGLKTILPLEVDSPQVADELNNLGVDPTFTNAISLRLIRKAMEEGNVTAFQAVRDTVGEKPADKTQLGVKQVRGMDLSRLTDQQLAELADREGEG